MMKRFLRTLLAGTSLCVSAVVAVLLSSCSNTDYVSNIPSGCSALMSVDAKNVDGVDGARFIKAVFAVDDAASLGIDFGSKVYFFEAADGNLGIAARLGSADKLAETIARLAAKGTCTAVKKRGDLSFSLFHGSWLVAFSDNALMVLGPITAASRADAERSVLGYFKQDEEHSIVATKIYQRLDTISAPIALVAQAQALPEKFVAPFTIGAPKDADASQVMIAARLGMHGKTLVIDGTTYSDNQAVDKALKEAHACFRPITPALVNAFDGSNMLGLFMNVDGNAFLPMLQQNKGIQALLVGLNTAIDMDNIIRSIDGDMSIAVPRYNGDGGMAMSLTAKLGNKRWLADIGYWKQSCPKGTAIADAGKDTYCYTDGKMKFFFGVTPSLYFVSGSSAEAVATQTAASAKPLPKEVMALVVGKRMAMVLGLKALSASSAGGVGGMLAPLVGDMDTVVYVSE